MTNKEYKEGKMKIYFDREWSRNEIRRIVEENCYLEFGKHEDLKALCIVPFARDEEECTSDYRELIYVVPAKWLEKVAEETLQVTDMDYWLQSEYTSEESESIFELALTDRQVVMVDFV